MRCTVTDCEKVNRILKDNSVYPYITDDGSPAKEDFSAMAQLEDKSCYILMPNKFTAILMTPVNCIVYDLHIGVLKKGRGQMAIDDLKKAINEYVFEQTPCRKIVIQAPVINKSMIRLAKNIGFKLEGVSKNSFLKHGKLHDRYLFGMSKEV